MTASSRWWSSSLLCCFPFSLFYIKMWPAFISGCRHVTIRETSGIMSFEKKNNVLEATTCWFFYISMTLGRLGVWRCMASSVQKYNLTNLQLCSESIKKETVSEATMWLTAALFGSTWSFYIFIETSLQTIIDLIRSHKRHVQPVQLYRAITCKERVHYTGANQV